MIIPFLHTRDETAHNCGPVLISCHGYSNQENGDEEMMSTGKEQSIGLGWSVGSIPSRNNFRLVSLRVGGTSVFSWGMRSDGEQVACIRHSRYSFRINIILDGDSQLSWLGTHHYLLYDCVVHWEGLERCLPNIGGQLTRRLELL